MIVLISPAKTFSHLEMKPTSTPYFESHANELIKKLHKVPLNKLKSSMKLSDQLLRQVKTYINYFNHKQYPAIYHYLGYQFQALDVNSLTDQEISYMQNHLYIVSGLYGLLKPLDAISSYRLEMKDKTIKNLYSYWNPLFKKYIYQYHKNDIIIDLLSSEYRKAFDGIHRIFIDFYEFKNHQLKSISMHVKRVRGLFARCLMKNQINDLSSIKDIKIEGFIFDAHRSTENRYVFIKEDS